MHDENLQIQVRMFGVAIDSPPRRSVATADPFIMIHCLEEIGSMVTIYKVFDRHKDGT